jgi:diketogulonate reductase-like aldo/keto reductase
MNSYPSSVFDTVDLNNGVKMPWLGLGVWEMSDGAEVERSVEYAFDVGYRSIDTAAIYRNEKGVGRAIKNSKLKREEVFLTSKVWNSDQGYDSTLKAFEKSLFKLETNYLDLYLIHWPVSGKFKDTWKALEKLYKENVVRAIGVSNFNIDHLKNLLSFADIIPTVNQIEFHPYLTHPDLIKFCRKHSIQIEAWSPIMQGKIGTVPEIVETANKYGKSPAQIVLRWDLQRDVITIPKSSNKNRISENAQIFDFSLKEEDMNLLNSLNRNYRFGPDPNNF